VSRAYSLSHPRPGDNTYSNYREASRALWRQVLPEASKKDVLPLVNRTAKALSAWLSEAEANVPVQTFGLGRGAALEFRPDLDGIEALTVLPEACAREYREALWTRHSIALSHPRLS
jgi:phage portal protein BeeE